MVGETKASVGRPTPYSKQQQSAPSQHARVSLSHIYVTTTVVVSTTVQSSTLLVECATKKEKEKEKTHFAPAPVFRFNGSEGVLNLLGARVPIRCMCMYGSADRTAIICDVTERQRGKQTALERMVSWEVNSYLTSRQCAAPRTIT